MWFWQHDRLQVYCLQNDAYQQQAKSKLFPDLNLALLEQYVSTEDPLEAIIEWRKQVQNS